MIKPLLLKAVAIVGVTGFFVGLVGMTASSTHVGVAGDVVVGSLCFLAWGACVALLWEGL